MEIRIDLVNNKIVVKNNNGFDKISSLINISDIKNLHGINKNILAYFKAPQQNQIIHLDHQESFSGDY